jgi:hypothetical protein
VFLSWLLFPLLLAVLCLGCGLIVDRLAGRALPTTLIAPVGFTVLVLIGEMTSIDSSLAELAAPLAVAFAVAGFGLGWKRAWTAKRSALAAPIAVFVVYALPVVASGDPTFTGYIKLDDTATWLALTDRVAEAGRDLSNLAPSTYEATLSYNLGSGYPIGAFTPLVIGSTLLGRDPAWIFQPYMATMAALLSLCLYELTRGLIRRPALRGAIAFLAAQPALLFGYYLWGGVKEIASALLLALLAALLPSVVGAERLSWRSALPPALAAAALLAVLTAAGAILWLLPILALGAFAVAVQKGGLATLRRLGIIAGVALLVSLPWLLDTGLLPKESGALSDPRELGNLIGPLSNWQAVGIWPVGDFRFHPTDTLATAVLIGVALLGVALGAGLIWKRRAVGPAALVAGTAIGAAALIAIGSPWIDGKALATCSPAILFAACLGGAYLWERGMRVEGGVLIALIALGVLWSNALGYRDALLAPYPRLVELERIGHSIAGEGPTLMTEYEPYGVRHFLRRADPEGASELRRRLVPLRSGGSLEKGETADIDQFILEGLLEYKTLVLRRSPLASRPPLPFQLTESRHFYDVWQSSGRPAPLEHLPLGDAESPSSPPTCAEVERLAALPGTVHLAASILPAPTLLPMEGLNLPAEWELSENGQAATPNSGGTATGSFGLARGGRFEIWLGGSSRGEIAIEIDGRAVASSGPEVDHPDEYRRLGIAGLRSGRHRLTIEYRKQGVLAPGRGGEQFAIGPVVLSSGTAADSRVVFLRPDAAQSLCGRRLDWVEALPY